jgi:alpha-amylase
MTLKYDETAALKEDQTVKHPLPLLLSTLLLGPMACQDSKGSAGPGDEVLPDPAVTEDGESADGLPTPLGGQRDNGVLMQYFHWYLPNDGQHWQRLESEAKSLAQAGFTALWLPPASKSSGGSDSVGYGTYDLYDLGEFNQKGSLRTKYGTKDQLLTGIQAAQNAGLAIYADIVMNHRLGADSTETVMAIPVNPNQRLEDIGSARSIQAWTRFEFPGRQGRYSSFVWSSQHFNGVDWDQNVREQGRIYRFQDKRWDSGVSKERGNYDYLLGSDLDMENPEVVAELKNWGIWYRDIAQLDGFRLDAVKHIHSPFVKEWLQAVRAGSTKELFSVAEYWDGDVKNLLSYLKEQNDATSQLSLFDVALHYRLHEASRALGTFDMTTLLNDTLMQKRPSRAVTFVDNHDTQPLQALESPVEDWFKPLAYALIMLRKEAYPAVFYADYYGASYTGQRRDGTNESITFPRLKDWIDLLLRARQQYAYGEQRSYFNHPDLIGWTRRGTEQHPNGLAVILSDRFEGSKKMQVGPEHAGKCFTDFTGQQSGCVTIDTQGDGIFPVGAAQASIWVGP